MQLALVAFVLCCALRLTTAELVTLEAALLAAVHARMQQLRVEGPERCRQLVVEMVRGAVVCLCD